MGPGQKCLIRIRSGQTPLNLEIFPQKIPIFQFFSLSIKKISYGRVKKYPGQDWVAPLFTAGQKYAQVGSGLGPFLDRRNKQFLDSILLTIYFELSDD